MANEIDNQHYKGIMDGSIKVLEHSAYHLYDKHHSYIENLEIAALKDLLKDNNRTKDEHLGVFHVVYYARFKRMFGPKHHPIEKHLEDYKHKSYKATMKEIYGKIGYLFWLTLNELHKLRALNGDAHHGWKHMNMNIPKLPSSSSSLPPPSSDKPKPALPPIGGAPVAPVKQRPTKDDNESDSDDSNEEEEVVQVKKAKKEETKKKEVPVKPVSKTKLPGFE